MLQALGGSKEVPNRERANPGEEACREESAAHHSGRQIALTMSTPEPAKIGEQDEARRHFRTHELWEIPRSELPVL